ncbi:hypothetical protein HYDPIDRAFT_105884 [Hydnomerulius pinastri MD-312]|nr:hypothetical protein HYDPIDRAFT_105871 [Hydnomerulius pinastri MD-312]KIJ69284.1 hypothetical protein HYDPIDRAFT_105884 [Hydnomerulius pinastri MD-312]
MVAASRRSFVAGFIDAIVLPKNKQHGGMSMGALAHPCDAEQGEKRVARLWYSARGPKCLDWTWQRSSI